MALDYLKLVALARRDSTLIPNHKQHVLPAVRRKIAELRTMIATLQAARGCGEMAAAFQADLDALLGVERFYESATVKPGAKPRYARNFIAYARAHGRTPPAQLAADEKRWPGGCMCGFMLWISQMRQQYLSKKPSGDVGGKEWVRFLFTDGIPLAL